VAEWAKALDLTVDALRSRLKRRSLEQIIRELEHPSPPPTPEIILYEKFPYRGREMTIPELAELAGITTSAMRWRLKASKPRWTPEEAVSGKRIRPGSKIVTVQTPEGPVGKTMTEWCEETGISISTISKRQDRGWTPEQALGFAPKPKTPRGAAVSGRTKRKDDD
jgi:hypothetical protein